MRNLKSVLLPASIAVLSLGAIATTGLMLSATEVAAKGKPEAKSNKGKAHSGAKKSAQAAKSQARAAVASELKNLNAMCANENAFANANADSNVGRIGSFYVAQAAAVTAEADLAAAQVALDTNLEIYGGMSSDEIQALIGAHDPLDLIGLAVLQRQLDYALAAELLQAEADALAAAVGDREISDDALAVFKAGCDA